MSELYLGDCRETLLRLKEEGVQCQTCVTSPPYYGLRDYGHPGQLGLESTPEEYISNMVEVFRAVRDVLADDGTLWLNLGDSYGKGKQLLGIPWRVAFALQSDGWILRQDIIWHKPNPMPESVTDRCTKAHEYLFLLSKAERYFFDSEAMKEPASQPFGKPLLTGQHKANAGGFTTNGTGASTLGSNQGAETRNRRSVWTVATRPYKGAHFATFPPALIEPCILAGSLPVGAYEPDGLILSPAGEGERDDDPSMIVGRAGWSRPRRDVEAIRPMSRQEQAVYAEQLRNSPHRETMMREAGGETTFAHYVRTDRSGARVIPYALLNKWIDIGWINRVSISPRLAEQHRSIVLDPFFGSGTTAQVAESLGREWIGCEVNPDYAPLHRQRIQQMVIAA